MSSPRISKRGQAVRTPELDVLLLDAEHRQSLATLRVLSRSGLRVGTAAFFSDSWWAPANKSRYSALRACVPDLGDDAAVYAAEVLRLLDEHPARMILPGFRRYDPGTSPATG